MTTTTDERAEAIRARFAPLLNQFGELAEAADGEGFDVSIRARYFAADEPGDAGRWRRRFEVYLSPKRRFPLSESPSAA